MPHTLGEIFTHAQYQISKTATAGPGADSVFVDHRVRSRARSSGQRCCKLRLKLLLVELINWQRRLES